LHVQALHYSLAVTGDRKPLVIRGARQVGKTVAVKLFGERFERFINLKKPGMQSAGPVTASE